MKNHKLSIAIALFGLLIITFSSCEKKEDNPPYVGTWVNIQSMDIFEVGMPIPVRTTIILSKSTIEYMIAIELDDQFEDVGGMKGNITVTEDFFILTPTSLGSINESEVIVWINKGEPGWEDELADWEMDETESAEYQLEGNTLTLSIDDTPTVFTRQ